MITKSESGVHLREEMAPEIDKYADAFSIWHKQGIFQLNFGYYLPGDKALWHTRLWASPRALKSIYVVLKRNIESFEENYGEIPEPKTEERESAATYGRAHRTRTVEELPEDMPKGVPLTKREG